MKDYRVLRTVVGVGHRARGAGVWKPGPGGPGLGHQSKGPKPRDSGLGRLGSETSARSVGLTGRGPRVTGPGQGRLGLRARAPGAWVVWARFLSLTAQGW